MFPSEMFGPFAFHPLSVGTITMTKKDLEIAKPPLPSILKDSIIISKLKPVENSKGHRLLVYFIPVNCVM
jgi:hypothetical protein